MKRRSQTNAVSNAATLLFMITLVFLSCTKNEDNTSLLSEEKAHLTFTVQGIEELHIESSKHAALYPYVDNNSQPEVTETKLSSNVIMSTTSEIGHISGKTISPAITRVRKIRRQLLIKWIKV